jgi:hypothetical protein
MGSRWATTSNLPMEWAMGAPIGVYIMASQLNYNVLMQINFNI